MSDEMTTILRYPSIKTLKKKHWHSITFLFFIWIFQKQKCFERVFIIESKKKKISNMTWPEMMIERMNVKQKTKQKTKFRFFWYFWIFFFILWIVVIRIFLSVYFSWHTHTPCPESARIQSRYMSYMCEKIARWSNHLNCFASVAATVFFPILSAKST